MVGEFYRVILVQDNASLLKRYGRKLSYIGWIVVLGTFLVRDVKRDRLRDVVQAVSSADALYSMRFDVQKLHDDVAQLSSEMKGLRSTKSAEPSMEADSTAHWNSLIAEVQNELTTDRYVLSALDVLAKTTDEWPEYSKESSAIASELNAADWSFGELTGRHRSSEPTRPPTNVAMRIPGAMNLHDSIGLLNERESYLIGTTLFKARKFQAEREKEYARWTYAFYVLYVVGWILGLLGLVSGAGGTSKAD